MLCVRYGFYLLCTVCGLIRSLLKLDEWYHKTRVLLSLCSIHNRVARWSLAIRSVLFGVNGSFARDDGVWSLSLRAPEAHGVHDVLVAKSVFRCVGNFLVCLKRSDSRVLSGFCSTPSTYSVSTTNLPLSQSHQRVWLASLLLHFLGELFV